MRRTLLISIILVTALFLFLNAKSEFAGVLTQASFKNVFIVVFENTDADQVLAQPTFDTLSKQGTYLSDFDAVTHPSQPNYIAMTSADTQGVTDDKPIDLDKKNIIDLLETKGITWKVYAEDYPGNCDASEFAGLYVRKHNPFISYNNIRNNAQRCANIVNADQLDKDIQAGTVPQFAFYIPNIKNDGHDTGVAYADNWLKTTMLPRFNNATFIKDRLVIITFDEGSSKDPTAENKIYTLFYGPMVQNQIIGDKYNFYNMLRTIEDAWALGTLGLNDESSKAIPGIWKK